MSKMFLSDMYSQYHFMLAQLDSVFPFFIGLGEFFVNQLDVVEP